MRPRPRGGIAAPPAAATLLAGLLLASRPAWAELPARGTAAVGERGSWSVGLLEPLTVGLGRGLELRAYPLVFLVAPNAVLRVGHGRWGNLELTGEYGLSIPTGAMRLLQGYLFPTWDTSDAQIGWFLVPRAGLVASYGRPDASVVSLRADVAVGLALTSDDTEPLDAPAPLDLLFAPAANGYRARVGAAYDRRLSARWRFEVGVDGFVYGSEPRFTVRADAVMAFALSPRARLTMGAMAWNSDEKARDQAGNPVRSTEILPVIDLVWTSQ